MIKKILPRILILLAVATLVSAIIVSSVFAKYTTNDSLPEAVKVRPTQFNVEYAVAYSGKATSADLMYANFSSDPYEGSEDKTFIYDVTAKLVDSEVSANLILKITFDPEMNTLINSNAAGISVTFSAYKVSEGGTETPLSLNQNGAEWTSAPDLLEIGSTNLTNTYRIKFTVHYTAGGTGAFIPDAIKVDVIATQVDPMK